jgi:hypothetical protein
MTKQKVFNVTLVDSENDIIHQGQYTHGILVDWLKKKTINKEMYKQLLVTNELDFIIENGDLRVVVQAV